MSKPLRTGVRKRRLPVFMCVFACLLMCMAAEAQFREIYKNAGADGAINGMYFLSPSTGFVAFANNVGFTTDSGHTFIHRDVLYGNTDYNGYSINLTFGFSAMGVHAFSTDSLLLYGDFGTEPSILFSANQGQTWKVVFHRELNINATSFNQGITDMEFPGNGNTGFAVHNEEIVKTTDRGQHWNTAVSVSDGLMRKLSFPAASTGYAVGGDKLFKTTNNGSSWTPVALPNLSAYSNFNNVFFTTATTGYITDYTYHRIFKTVNGGASWMQMNDETVVPVSGNDLYFTNDSTGFIAPGYAYQVYKTINSGKTWEPCKRNTDYQYLYYGLNALHFFNDSISWAGGRGEYLMITTNGGSPTLPKAYFKIDTTGLAASGIVNLVNYSNTGYQYRWYKNDVQISTDYNASYVHDLQQPEDSIKLIVTNGTDADTLVQYIYFEVRPLPVITNFYPQTGSTGTEVTINGNNFDGSTSVSFGGVPAASFTVASTTQIMAIVGTGASGSVTVATGNGQSGSLPGFLYTAPPSSPPPAIASFSPASGPVGTTVTITGSNFNSTSANNLVYFGIAKATVTSATASQLICKVPISATLQPIVVLNTQTHLSGSSRNAFNVTFADSSNFTPHSFSMGYSIDYSSALREPQAVSAGDVDGDGKPDMIATTSFLNQDSIIVYRNTTTAGTIGFDAGTGLPAMSRVTQSPIVLGDIDGDGKPDFAATTNNSYNVVVARNTSTPGNITSGPVITVPTAPGSQRLIIDDLDHDGRPDLAVATFNIKMLSIVRNTSSVGNISFAQRTDYPVGGNAVNLAIGDLDGDGKKDIVVDNFNYDNGPSHFSVLKNTSTVGAISFAPKEDIETPDIGAQARDIFVEDVDGDNKPDIVVVNEHTFTVYKNTSASGAIAFEAGKIYEAFSSPQGVSMDNLNGDAKPDFVGGMFGTRGIKMFDNDATADSIHFESGVDLQELYPVVGSVYSSATADFNGDGKQDLAVVSVGTFDKYFFVLNNTVGKPIPFEVCPKYPVSIQSDITGDTYQWQQNKGNGFIDITDNNYFSGTATDTLSVLHPPVSWTGYTYRCVVGDRKSSNYLLTVSPLQLPHATISTNDTAAVCPGTKLTFVAKGSNTGPDPYFEWQKNGVDIPNYGTYNVITQDSVSTFYTYQLNDSDVIRTIMHGTDPCGNNIYDTSNTIRVSVIGGGYPLVKIASSVSSACAGDTVTFTSTTTYCGAHPTYQWQVNGVNAGTNSPVFTTTTLQNNDIVFLTVTPEPTSCNAGQIATDQTYIPVSSSGTPSIVISTPSNTVCSGTPVTFTATATNAGSSPVYQWQVNGVNAGNNSFIFTTANLHNNDQVSCMITSNASCAAQSTATSNIISVTVNTVVANAGTDQTICAGTNITIGSSATANNSYSWTSNPAGFTSTEAAPQVQPTATTTYFVKAINGSCVAQDTIVINVVQATANAGADQTICNGGSASIGSAAIAGNSYSWTSVPAGFTSTIANPNVSPAITTSYIVKVNNGNCVASDTVTIQVNPAQALSLPDSIMHICAGSNASIGVAAQAGYQYSWTSNPAGFISAIANPVVSPAAATTYLLTATNNANGCKATGQVQVLPASCNQQISLYPNPARSFIHIQLDTLTSATTIFQLIDANGKVVLQQNLSFDNQIYIAKYQSGLYEFIIRRNNAIISKGQLVILH